MAVNNGRTPLSGPERRGSSRGKPARPPYGIALDLGMRLGLSVIIGIGAGLLVDNWLGTSPIFTLIGVALGIATAMYTIWDVARDHMR
ncbi:MAG TPA: AtpZ/AtpI family protein [Candidatus Angelobacter sp.]|nr:AtpZ/AtpI family protein [Candidatus Angelobacter sp.]